MNVLYYLRSNQIVHRDLKPANICLNELWQIKLSDFGTAIKITDNSESCSASANSDISQISGISGISNISANLSGSSTVIKAISSTLDKRVSKDDIVGSEFYVSPEMVEKKEYSYASDLWALGVILFQMFTGELPFKGKTQEKTLELI